MLLPRQPPRRPPAGTMRCHIKGYRREHHHRHRPVQGERHRAGQSDPVRAGVQPGGCRGAPAPDRGGEPAVNAVPVILGEQALEARGRPTARQLSAVSCRRCTVFHSRSKQTSTSPARRRPTGSRRSRPPIRRWTPRSSSGCGPPGRSRSATPTCPTSRSAGTPTANCGSHGQPVGPVPPGTRMRGSWRVRPEGAAMKRYLENLAVQL